MTASCQSARPVPDSKPVTHRGRQHGSGRTTLYLLLAIVAGAAAMLSFAALRDLAELCGFARVLAWLLPVVIDAGAAAGSLVWLSEHTGTHARVFARRLALGLLALSVAANALGHGLAAYALAPPWWVVVALSGIAPAVLGAMVHLAVLVGRPEPAQPDAAPVEVDEHLDGSAESTQPVIATDGAGGVPGTWATTPPPPTPTPTGSPDGDERVAALVAAGAGRRRVSRELGVSEHEARRLLDRARSTTAAPAPRTPTQTSINPAAADAVVPASSGALS